MDVDRLLTERSEHDEFLRDHYGSPLPKEHRSDFGGLDHFPPDATWELTGDYEPIPPRKVPIPSSAGIESSYTMIGGVTISIGESTYRLTVLDDGDGGAFIPFRDGTSGIETYGGGRYVGVATGSAGAVTIDFNTAQNPWCVYDEEFTCPLPSAENWVAERIPAGAKMYEPPNQAAAP